MHKHYLEYRILIMGISCNPSEGLEFLVGTSKRLRLDRTAFTYSRDNGPLLGESALSSNAIFRGALQDCRGLLGAAKSYLSLEDSIRDCYDLLANLEI